MGSGTMSGKRSVKIKRAKDRKLETDDFKGFLGRVANEVTKKLMKDAADKMDGIIREEEGEKDAD